MPKKHFFKLIKSIESCETHEQYLTCYYWIKNLKEIYRFGLWQLLEINDKLIEVSSKLEGSNNGIY